MEAPSLKDQNILVTGGAGFIGSNLCEHFLSTGNKVTCLDSLITGHHSNIEPFLSNPNFTFVKGDICDHELCLSICKGVDIVYHQAALGSVPRSIENPQATNANNITGFLSMLDAARLAGVKRFVYAASSSTYGDNYTLPKLEDNIGRPLSPYAVTKYVNELYAGVFADLYGMETIGLRYFNVFGRRQDPKGAYAAVIPKFIDLFLANESPVINGDGEQTRDFTYIDNVVHANVVAGLTDNPEALNQVYNVAYGENITLNQLAEHLKDLLSEFFPEVASIAVNHGPDRAGDIRLSLASVDKARNLLGYNPTHGVMEGLRETIAFYVEDHKLRTSGT